MNHQATFFLADRHMNNMMKGFDLKPDHKWFIYKQHCDFTTTTTINEQYFMDIIEKSKAQEEFWIPVITYMGSVFNDPSVKVISDGDKEMFITGGAINEGTKRQSKVPEVREPDTTLVRGLPSLS